MLSHDLTMAVTLRHHTGHSAVCNLRERGGVAANNCSKCAEAAVMVLAMRRSRK